MADENVINGVASDGDVRTVAIDGVPENDRDQSKMVLIIKELEEEKARLERENSAIRERIGNLTAKVQQLRNDKVEMDETMYEMQKKIEQSESDKKAAEAIAARAVELETELSRLQTDLITSMSEGEEANAEVLKLKALLEVKVTELEKLEKEKAGLCGNVEKIKAEVESMAVQLKNEISEKAKVEEDAKAEIGKKESEINELKKRIEELEKVVAKDSLELENMIKEKKTEVGAKDDAIDSVKRENEKVGVLESKLCRLMQELEESKRVITELKEKAINGVNGVATAAREEIFGTEEKGIDGLKLHWPAVAVATGAVVTVAAVVYLRCAK